MQLLTELQEGLFWFKKSLQSKLNLQMSVENNHKLTFSINIHPLTVILFWCDWTPEQGSWSTATQVTLSCSLRGTHQHPGGALVPYITGLSKIGRNLSLAAVRGKSVLVQNKKKVKSVDHRYYTTKSLIFHLSSVFLLFPNQGRDCVCIQPKESFALGETAAAL